MFCWNALAGDLTEKQKKIFRENKFYHGYTIPEPKEMVRKLMQQLTFSSTRSLFSWLQHYNFHCCRRKVEPRSTSVYYLVFLCCSVCRGCKQSNLILFQDPLESKFKLPSTAMNFMKVCGYTLR